MFSKWYFIYYSSTTTESFLLDENHPVNFDQTDGEDVVSTTSSFDSSTRSITSDATSSTTIYSSFLIVIHPLFFYDNKGNMEEVLKYGGEKIVKLY